MRLFVALPIPEPARDEIAALLVRLQSCEWPVRWISGEGLHITLKFYGEVMPERLDVIAESVRFAAADAAPLAMRVAELGAFPSRRHARVLWLGLDAPPALELLQDRLERGGEQIGFPPEGAPFRPHVTLGRVREGHRLPRAALEAFADSYDHIGFVADEVVLYESVLSPTGPRYEARLTVPLAG
ncbi:MAG TPA: RNA 2',3'-cyclic phosphodiesterase [Gemmatimonadales bacterium]|jgi:2'-5' RNA ligase|nr:RNA 2',3'-cyclic phosphodiesterase [Gemmatimonadales bacterium]